MTIKRSRLAGALLLLGAIAACGGGGGARPGIEIFGDVFQRAFAQGPNDAPVDVTNSGLSLDLTGEPIEL